MYDVFTMCGKAVLQVSRSKVVGRFLGHFYAGPTLRTTPFTYAATGGSRDARFVYHGVDCVQPQGLGGAESMRMLRRWLWHEVFNRQPIVR